MALGEQRDTAPGVRALLARHSAGTAIVQVAATTAAETQRDGQLVTNFAIFHRRLQVVGMGHLPILKPVMTWDFAYWDWAVWPGESTDRELRDIHEVLFPARPFDFTVGAPLSLEEHGKAQRKWRNYRRDGLGLHTHIQAGGDVYVTSDQNFMKETKKAPLSQLGASIILNPHEAEAYAASIRGSAVSRRDNPLSTCGLRIRGHPVSDRVRVDAVGRSTGPAAPTMASGTSCREICAPRLPRCC